MICRFVVIFNTKQLDQKATFAFVSRQQRQRLTKIAVIDCKRVMLLMIKCGMPIKPAEAKRLAVGVLYASA